MGPSQKLEDESGRCGTQPYLQNNPNPSFKLPNSSYILIGMRQTFISALAATALFTTTPALAQENGDRSFFIGGTKPIECSWGKSSTLRSDGSLATWSNPFFGDVAGSCTEKEGAFFCAFDINPLGRDVSQTVHLVINGGSALMTTINRDDNGEIVMIGVGDHEADCR
ncbi:hypothetical protein BOA8489_02146 [Boseongicola aestuarii]|uniref:Uncharacterized protein n=1 Tax=Boseongicola aestuarii TaxID=1470561 RepID=A0A238J150_9RHOB|nr:hypothetical protein BOA8489_02146 [Boseongicola aestuarii]